MKATQILINEHKLILKVLYLLSHSRKELENGRHIPGLFFKKAMVFCSDFANKFHHFKEEFLLFGLLSYKNQGQLDTAMGTLRYQHERCTQCITGINQALEGYEEKDELAITLLLENLAVYVSLLSRHINDEDTTFFPLADKSLSEDENNSLLRQFEKEELRVSKEEPIFEKSQKIVDELKFLLGPG